MVSMATHYADCKDWGYMYKKYSYLNNISSYITKHGTKLIPGHSNLIWQLDMQII